MRKDEKSDKSRRSILAMSLELFSSRGYGATSVRDIADATGLSTGNVYHHFPDKEAIFQELLQQFWEFADSPQFPFAAAMAASPFPENVESLGRAAEQILREWKRHIALIYVDVIEFDGIHIRKFYAGLARRVEEQLASQPNPAEIQHRLRPGVSPVSAVLLTTRFFVAYFTIEILFGVQNHFGKSSEEVVREIADIIRHGVEAKDPDPLTQRKAP